MGSPVGAPHYGVRVHLRLSVLEGDVANERKQFQLFAGNAGSELSQPSFAYESAPMALKLLPASFWFFENCCSTLAISSPVSKIREKPSVRPRFVSTACCFPLLEMRDVICSHHRAALIRKYFRLFCESRGKFDLLAGRLLDF
jgi:hypothetical protein